MMMTFFSSIAFLAVIARRLGLFFFFGIGFFLDTHGYENHWSLVIENYLSCQSDYSSVGSWNFGDVNIKVMVRNHVLEDGMRVHLGYLPR